MTDVDEEMLEELYSWVDKIPLTRPKKDIRRDFSDGVMIAELIRHFLPKIVETHNYTTASKVDNKITNWKLLNRKVFKKLGFEVSDDVIQNVTACKPWAIEQFLIMLRRKIDRYMYENQRNTERSAQPEAEQNIYKDAVNDHKVSGSPPKGSLGGVPRKSPSLQNLKITSTTQKAAPGAHGIGGRRGENVVPKLVVEEREQEILAKDETIQILQAKVRRLEHLLHLKDIRIDDLQGRLDRMETQLRPTANYLGKR